MNEYLFLTTQGKTLAPNDDYSVENCQLLGRVNAKGATEAQAKLLYENPWISEAGFDSESVIVDQVVTKEQLADIKTVVDYFEADAKKYDEKSHTKNHLYLALRRLRNMIVDV